MVADPTAGRSGVSRRFIALGAAVALAIAGWTVAWFLIRADVATEVDREIDRLAETGFAVTCPGRSIGGYPFRIEIRCASGLAVEDRRTGLGARFSGGRTVTLLYNPALTILELDGPAALERAGVGVGEARWTRLRASIRASDGGPRRLTVETDAIDARLAPPNAPAWTLKAARAVLHGEDDAASPAFLLGARLVGAAIGVGGRAIGPDALDVVADAAAIRLPASEAGSIAEFLAAWAGNDGRLDIRAVRASAGGLAVDARGALALEVNGRLTGAIKLVATGLETVAAGGGRLSPDLAVMTSGFLLFGKPHKEGEVTGRALEFTIEQGRMRIGPTPLGVLPPLFQTDG